MGKKSQKGSIWCLVFGILSISYAQLFGLMAAIPGIVCGHVSLAQIRKEPEKYGGRKKAMAGLVLCYLGLLLFILLVILHMALRDELMKFHQ